MDIIVWFLHPCLCVPHHGKPAVMDSKAVTTASNSSANVVGRCRFAGLRIYKCYPLWLCEFHSPNLAILLSSRSLPELQDVGVYCRDVALFLSICHCYNQCDIKDCSGWSTGSHRCRDWRSVCNVPYQFKHLSDVQTMVELAGYRHQTTFVLMCFQN
jgi:hypothetical protein